MWGAWDPRCQTGGGRVRLGQKVTNLQQAADLAYSPEHAHKS
jgi:hypothetical protein